MEAGMESPTYGRHKLMEFASWRRCLERSSPKQKKLKTQPQISPSLTGR